MSTKIQAKLLRTLKGHRQSVYCTCLLPPFSLLSSGGDGLIVDWNPLETDLGVAIATVGEPVYSMACLADNVILAGGHSGSIYHLKNGNVRKIGAHKHGVFGLFSYNGEILSLGGDGVFMRWTQDLEWIQSIQVSQRSLRAFAPFPTGFALAGSEGKLFLFSSDYRLLETVEAQGNTIFALTYLQNSGLLVSGGRDATLQSYQIMTAENSGLVSAHLLHIHDLKTNPAQTLLASASMDKTIKIWNPENLELLKVLNLEKFGLHTSSVNNLTWLNDHVLVSASDDRSIGVWEIN